MPELSPHAPRRHDVLASDVVGRTAEIDVVRSAVTAAAHGIGGVLFLVGEAGIGKTRIAQLVAGEAEREGRTVLWGRAVPTSTPVAHRPIAEALIAAARTGAVGNHPDLEPFRPTLGRLVPDWRVSGHVPTDDATYALAEGVLRVLRRAAADRGCVIVLEDLHWADPETLAVVEYLADNLTSEPVLCLATLRDDADSPGWELVRTLRTRRASHVVELGRLDGDDVDRLLCSCLGTDHLAPGLSALAARADGVPFLVEELLAVAVASGALVHDGVSWSFAEIADHVVPLTFADTVRRRLVASGSLARLVLGAAAIQGRAFDWRLLAPTTGLEESEIVASLRAAVQHQLLSVDADGTFFFRHALSRDAVLAELLPPERGQLSERALTAIEAAHPGLPGPWCELAAEVAEAAGDRSRAAALLLEEGRRALEGGALATAGATLEHARALAPDPSVRLDVEDCLLTVLALAGSCDRAVEIGEALLQRLGTSRALARRRAEVHLRLANAAVAAARWTEVDQRLERATREAATVTDDGLRCHLDVVAAQVAVLRRPAEAAERAQAALDAAVLLDLPVVACEALEILGRLERSRDLDAAESSFRRAEEIAVRAGGEIWRMRALHELGTIDLLRNGNVTRLEQARDLSVRLGAPSTTAVLGVQIGAALSVRDDPEACIEACRSAAALARRSRIDVTLAAALAFEAAGHARAGRQLEWERCTNEALEVGGDLREVGYNVGWARAQLALVRDDRSTAIADLTRGMVGSSEAVGVEATGPSAGVLALLVAVDGDDPTAIERLRPPPIHFLGRGFARFAEAVIAGRGGEAAAAAELVERGDGDLDGFEWYRQLGRRLVAEAAITDRWGDPVAWLLEALAYFQRSADDRIASACRSLLRRAGAPVPRRRDPPAECESLRHLGITAREGEVLQLIGTGASNRDIGARLYMSARTVERHVASLVGKAGVARRAELVAFAARTLGSAGPGGVAPVDHASDVRGGAEGGEPTTRRGSAALI